MAVRVGGAPGSAWTGRDRGSAAVDFVLVAPLVLLLALALVQVALVLHVRATLTAAAAEGARAASLAGASSEVGARRTRDLLVSSISESAVRDVSVRMEVQGRIEVIVVRIESALPLVGLFGPTAMTVEGRALKEGWT